MGAFLITKSTWTHISKIHNCQRVHVEELHLFYVFLFITQIALSYLFALVNTFSTMLNSSGDGDILVLFLTNGKAFTNSPLSNMWVFDCILENYLLLKEMCQTMAILISNCTVTHVDAHVPFLFWGREKSSPKPLWARKTCPKSEPDMGTRFACSLWLKKRAKKCACEF